MRVLFINTVCGRSSTGGIIRDIDSVLKQHGSVSMCLYGRYDAPAQMCSKKIETTMGFYKHVLLTRFFDRQGFGSRKATKRAIKEIERFQPDIIHLHNLHGSYINIKLLFDYLKNTNIPIVWTLHDCWAFTGHCTHYLYDNCNKWMNGTCDRCPQKKEYPASIFLDQSKRNYKEKKDAFLGCNNLVITVVSDWLCGQVKQSFLREYPIKRIYNGVDTEIFKPTESNVREKIGITESEIMILCVTDGWSTRKGINYIFELFEQCKALSLPYRIVMVGVQEKVRKEIPKGIIALPRTDNVNQLVELYSCADVFWNPSKIETFGMVNIEALACGTPVITMNSTACPETIDLSCGITIDPDEAVIKQVLDAIPLLAGNGKKNQDACRKKAEAFSKTQSYTEYIKLYNEIYRGERNET